MPRVARLVRVGDDLFPRRASGFGRLFEVGGVGRLTGPSFHHELGFEHLRRGEGRDIFKSWVASR